MKGKDVKFCLDKNTAELEALLREGTFVLNPRIRELLEENEEIRSQCEHELVEDGVCAYCGKVIKDESDTVQH